MTDNRRFARFADGNGSALEQTEPVGNSLQQADVDIFGGEIPVRRNRVPENALVSQGDGVFVYKRFKMTPVGMEMPEDVTKDELLEVGEVVKNLESSIQWIIGDLMNAIQFKWGEGYQYVAEKLGYEVKTVYEWAYVCRKVSIRMEKPLRFGHHQLVAKLSPEDQVTWLEGAREGKWSISKMRKLIADHYRPAPPEPIAPEATRNALSRLSTMTEIVRDDPITVDRITRDLDQIEELITYFRQFYPKR